MATRGISGRATSAVAPKPKRSAGSRRASSRLFAGSGGGVLQLVMNRPRLELRRLAPPGKNEESEP